MAPTDPSAPRVAVGFPGQGGDWRAALRILEANHAHPIVEALAGELGTTAWAELDGRDTRAAQPVIVATGLIAAEAATGATSTIGHSLGEITAAAFAGALVPSDAIALAALRAELGHRCHAQRQGAMIAVMRLDPEQIEWLRRDVLGDEPGILELAVRNSATQSVLSGDRTLVALATERAEALGAVVHQLPIGGAFHSPLLSSVVADLRAAAAAVLGEPAIPVFLSTRPGSVASAEELADRLARSLVLPVHWPDAVAALVAGGTTQLVDAGPGDTLVRLGRHLPLVDVVPIEAR